MSVKKSSTLKINRRTAAQIEVTREDALMLFKAIEAAGVGTAAEVDILGHVDDVLNATPASDPSRNKRLFLKLFVDGWQQASHHTRTNVGEIIQRVRAGQTVEEIHEHFQREWARIRAENEEKERNKPEPKNWLSSEWRYWKIRQLTRAFTGDDAAAYAAAGKEYQTLLRELVRDENFYHVDFALQLLPQLLIACQEIAQFTGQPKSARRKPEVFKTKKGGARR